MLKSRISTSALIIATSIYTAGCKSLDPNQSGLRLGDTQIEGEAISALGKGLERIFDENEDKTISEEEVNKVTNQVENYWSKLDSMTRLYNRIESYFSPEKETKVQGLNNTPIKRDETLKPTYIKE